MDRRRLLQAACGIPLAAALPPSVHARPALSALACARRGDRYLVAGLGADGEVVFERSLPGRGHTLVRRPLTGEALAIARKPGTFIVPFDAATGDPTGDVVAARRGRHFYGHGAFSADGRYLLTTENDFDAGVGVIGVRDASEGYVQIAELESGGIGPHELRVLEDGTVAVANGGIRTHPDTGSAKLNLDTMRPNVARVDLASGAVHERFELHHSLRALSLRHLDVSRDGRVVVATQHHGSRRDVVPAVLLLAAGALRPLDYEGDSVREMRQYVGSVAFDGTGTLVAATSPHGSRLVVWETGTGRVVGACEVDDVCGLTRAPGGAGWIATSGRGRLFTVRVSQGALVTSTLAEAPAMRWDNHLNI